MSWDIFGMRYPENVNKVSDVHPDFEPPLIKHITLIKSNLMQIIGDLDFDEDNSAEFNTKDYSVMIYVSDTSISFFIHGQGNLFIPKILEISKILNIRFVDGGSGEFLNRSNIEKNFARYKDFRDKVLSQ